MFLDFDHCRRVNDTDGHAAGGSMVTDLAQDPMRQACDENTLIRNNGDELLYPLINPPRRKPVAHIAGRAREAIESLLDVGSLAVAPSVGIALCSDRSTSGQTPIAHAEAAMYRAERLRSHCELFEPPTASSMALRWQTDRIA
jgi:diguanylate cyclase (GGDEF)-like protein